MHYWNRTMEKLLNDRIQTLLEDAELLKIYQKFGAGYFRRSSIFHGLDEILRKNKVRGELCLEYGTWNGLTAVVLSRYFKKVVTIDIAHNREKYEVIDFIKRDNIKCINIQSNAEKEEIAKRYDFDFAYLDGNHENDTLLDWGLVKHCGRVLFHEAWPHQKPVWELVESLPKNQVIIGDDGIALWDKSRG